MRSGQPEHRPQVLLDQLASIGQVLGEAQRARDFDISDRSVPERWQQLSKAGDVLRAEIVALHAECASAATQGSWWPVREGRAEAGRTPR